MRSRTKTAVDSEVIPLRSSHQELETDKMEIADQGRVIEEGSPDTVFTQPTSARTAEFLSRILQPQVERPPFSPPPPS